MRRQRATPTVSQTTEGGGGTTSDMDVETHDEGGSSDAAPIIHPRPLIQAADFGLVITVNEEGRPCTGMRIEDLLIFMILNAASPKKCTTVTNARNFRQWKRAVPGATKGEVTLLEAPAGRRNTTKGGSPNLRYIAVAHANAAVLKYCGAAGWAAFNERLDAFRTQHARGVSKQKTRQANPALNLGGVCVCGCVCGWVGMLGGWKEGGRGRRGWC